MGLIPGARLVDYCGSKAAAIAIHESLRMELERLEARDIHTLLVCPYIIDTGMFDGALKGPSQTWVTSLVLHWIFPYISTQSAANSILKAMRERAHFLLIPTVLQYYVILLLR